MTAHPFFDNQPAGPEGDRPNPSGDVNNPVPDAQGYPTQASSTYAYDAPQTPAYNAPTETTPMHAATAPDASQSSPTQSVPAYESTSASEARPDDSAYPYGSYGAYAPYGGYQQSTGYPTQTYPPQQPPADPPSGGTPSDPGKPKKRRRAAVVALVAAACLVGGAAGGAAGAEIIHNNETPAAAAQTSGDTTSGTTTDSGSSTPVDIPSGTVESAAAKIMPSVVVIEVTGQSGGGTGSGVVIDTNGDIVTNAHVAQAVKNPTIKVTFSDGQTSAGTVVGIDASSDLAVIKVTGISNLTPATFANSDDLEIGQTVVAVGAPLGLAGTVTEGIVSAVQRPVRTGSAESSGSQSQSTVIDAIQTDAAINPGNSGGPLVNLSGEVVGINSAIATVGDTTGESGNIGVGFSIPSNDVTNIADQLVKSGTAVHATLGVTVGDSKDGSGPVLEQVASGSPAAAAGLKAGDIITKVGDRTVYDVDSLLAAVRDHQPGDQVTITLLRGGDEQTVTVTMGSKEG